MSLILQLHGILLLWKIHAKMWEEEICLAFLRKCNNFLQKLKRNKQRLNRKQRSRQYKAGCIELWCENILTWVTPDKPCKKNVRTSEKSFMELISELSPYTLPHHLPSNYRSLVAHKKDMRHIIWRTLVILILIVFPSLNTNCIYSIYEIYVISIWRKSRRLNTLKPLQYKTCPLVE